MSGHPPRLQEVAGQGAGSGGAVRAQTGKRGDGPGRHGSQGFPDGPQVSTGLGLTDQLEPEWVGQAPWPGRRARSPAGGRRHRGASPVRRLVIGRASGPAGLCSTVIWDVGGTLVDRVIGPMEAVARALEKIGLRLDAIDAAILERSRLQYLHTEPLWSTPEEERVGFESIAAILLSGTERADDAEQIARLGQALGEFDWVYHTVPGIPELL